MTGNCNYNINIVIQVLVIWAGICEIRWITSHPPSVYGAEKGHFPRTTKKAKKGFKPLVNFKAEQNAVRPHSQGSLLPVPTERWVGERTWE